MLADRQKLEPDAPGPGRGQSKMPDMQNFLATRGLCCQNAGMHSETKENRPLSARPVPVWLQRLGDHPHVTSNLFTAPAWALGSVSKYKGFPFPGLRVNVSWEPAQVPPTSSVSAHWRG
jgi:hypothetical protein